MLLLLLEMLHSSSNRFNCIRGRIVYPFAATQQQRGRGFKGDFQGYPYPKTANQNGGGIGGILYKGGQFLLPYAKRAAVAGVKAAIPVAGGAALNLIKGKGKKKTVALAKKKLKAKAKKIGVQTTANALQDIVLSAKPKPKKMTAKPKTSAAKVSSTQAATLAALNAHKKQAAAKKKKTSKGSSGGGMYDTPSQEGLGTVPFKHLRRFTGDGVRKA